MIDYEEDSRKINAYILLESDGKFAIEDICNALFDSRNEMAPVLESVNLGKHLASALNYIKNIQLPCTPSKHILGALALILGACQPGKPLENRPYAVQSAATLEQIRKINEDSIDLVNHDSVNQIIHAIQESELNELPNANAIDKKDTIKSKTELVKYLQTNPSLDNLADTLSHHGYSKLGDVLNEVKDWFNQPDENREVLISFNNVSVHISLQDDNKFEINAPKTGAKHKNAYTKFPSGFNYTNGRSSASKEPVIGVDSHILDLRIFFRKTHVIDVKTTESELIEELVHEIRHNLIPLTILSFIRHIHVTEGDDGYNHLVDALRKEYAKKLIEITDELDQELNNGHQFKSIYNIWISIRRWYERLEVDNLEFNMNKGENIK